MINKAMVLSQEIRAILAQQRWVRMPWAHNCQKETASDVLENPSCAEIATRGSYSIANDYSWGTLLQMKMI